MAIEPDDVEPERANSEPRNLPSAPLQINLDRESNAPKLLSVHAFARRLKRLLRPRADFDENEFTLIEKYKIDLAHADEKPRLEETKPLVL